jgi:hypothetical protein
MKTRWLLATPLLFVAPALSQESPQADSGVNHATDPTSVEYARNLASAVDIIAEGQINPPTRVQMIQWAVAGLFRGMKKPVPSGIVRRIAKLTGADEKEVLLALQDIRSSFGEARQLGEGKDLQMSLDAIFAEVEPGARPEDRASYTPKTEIFCDGCPIFSGIGLRVEVDPETRMIRVITPIYRGPAYKAGVRAGDLIVDIQLDTTADGVQRAIPKVVSTKGMSVEEARKLFLGQSGTSVILHIIPARRAE